MSVFVTYPRAGDGNLASDQRSGATPAGEASAESGGADSDWRGVGREKRGAVVEPRSKIPQQPGSQANQAVKPGNLGLLGHLGNLGQPGQPDEAPCRASRVRRPERNHAWPQRKRAGHKEIKIPLGNLQ